jgi:hypothetical protein
MSSVAGTIGFSRITLQAHFPAEVFLGAALGYSISRFAVLRGQLLAVLFAKRLSGRVVVCTACSWRAPMMGEDISSAEKEFDAHICADHPPLKNIPRRSSTSVGTCRYRGVE